MIKLNNIPSYGDLFTLSDFRDMVKTGVIIPGEDGSGYWAYEDLMSDLVVTLPIRKPFKSFTHVVWFNK